MSGIVIQPENKKPVLVCLGPCSKGEAEPAWRLHQYHGCRPALEDGLVVLLLFKCGVCDHIRVYGNALTNGDNATQGAA